MKYSLVVFSVASASAIKLNPYDLPRETSWDGNHPGFEIQQSGFTGKEGIGYYIRENPEPFLGPGSGDDQFTSSMISKYALEEATKDGRPNGHFVMKKSHTMLAAQEIMADHW